MILMSPSVRPTRIIVHLFWEFVRLVSLVNEFFNIFIDKSGEGY